MLRQAPNKETRAVRFVHSRGIRAFGAAMLLLAATACGIPRPGPTKQEVLESGIDQSGSAYVVPVDERVTRATAVIPPLGFSESFRNAGVVGSDDIRPGDTLGLTIWENVDEGLLAPQGTNSTQLTEVQVDGDGFIFVPYAGRIMAAGNTPEALRRIITEKLEGQTPDPQVSVTRVAGDGATVSVVGGVGAQGVYALERPTRTLSSMLARAGGVTIPTEIAQVTVTRGKHSGKVWLTDLYSNPRQDIALRPGDIILVEEDQRSFIALGATGGQSRVPFETQTLSALEAIAQVGGLSTGLADPKGVFILRDESEKVAEAVLGRDLSGEQRMIYILDLTQPNGIFNARDFVIRDDDTVYVTEAPFVQWQKALSAITTPLATAGSVNALVQ
jgi:polysaccharide export outer membrane protein